MPAVSFADGALTYSLATLHERTDGGHGRWRLDAGEGVDEVARLKTLRRQLKRSFRSFDLECLTAKHLRGKLMHELLDREHEKMYHFDPKTRYATKGMVELRIVHSQHQRPDFRQQQC